MDKILLIDAYNAFWRATVSFGPPRSHDICEGYDSNCVNPKHMNEPHCYCGSPWHVAEQFCYGEKYSFIFNFFRNLRPQIEDGSPDKCFIVLEGFPQFRYDLYSDYKANRRLVKQASAKQEVMDKFQASKDEIIRLLQYLPITVVRSEHYEADDLVGTLCENMKEEDLTIITADADYIQLLQRGYKHITIYNPIKKAVMEAPEYPFIAYRTLVGDKSDNIPRIVSDKKALKFMSDPFAFAEFMKIEENRAKVSINKKLVQFAEVPEEEIIFQEGSRNFDLLKQKFAKMKFESIVNDKSWEKYTSTFDCLKY